jgi:translation initiation factor 4G
MSGQAPSPSTPSSHSKKASIVRIETVEAKEKRLAEEEAKKVAAEQAAKELARQNRRKKKKKKKKAHLQREEEDKVQQERIRNLEEETEREEEEKEVLRLEEGERLKQEEEEARLQREEEEKKLMEQAIEVEEREEGEVLELPSFTNHVIKDEEAVQNKRELLRIDTQLSSPSSPKAKRRLSPLDLSVKSKASVALVKPSALATARFIEDLGRVSYPEGIMSPKVELNVNAKNGKFR